MRSFRFPAAFRRARKVQSSYPWQRRHLPLLGPAIVLAIRLFVAMTILAFSRKSSAIRKYLIGGTATIGLSWTIILGYLIFAPTTYASHWSLILPTSSSSVSLQLESIGHAQTVASSPFGSASLSPKVIYKEIIGSEKVRLAAARSMDMTLPAFGTAKVKLIDETALVMLEIAGRSPVEAQAKARALNAAFETALDTLRRDEIKRRSDVVMESLTVYQENLQIARQRIIEQQERTGVLSINQFNEASSSLEQLRRRLNEVRADLDKQAAEQRLLAEGIGMDSVAATGLLKLAGDPAFGKLAAEFADVATQMQQEMRHLGDANPTAIALKRRAANVTEQLKTMLARVIPNDVATPNLLLITNGTQSADMMRALVTSAVSLAGRRAEAEAIEAEFKRMSAQVTQMSRDAARLEDLRKDHIVAEAVFTSALARLDTNRVDIYASYPMVQMLAAPDLPEKKSNPSTLIILLCGVIATLLSVGGWSTAWLRQAFVQKRPKRN